MGIKIFNQYNWNDVKESVLNEVWENYNSFEELVNTLENRFNGLRWETLVEWEEMEDVKILECLSSLNEFKGDLLVITDISYKCKYGPFGVASKNISCFAEEFWTNFGECMFNGDTLIVDESQRVIWLFHHEGLYTSLMI